MWAASSSCKRQKSKFSPRACRKECSCVNNWTVAPGDLLRSPSSTSFYNCYHRLSDEWESHGPPLVELIRYVFCSTQGLMKSNWAISMGIANENERCKSRHREGRDVGQKPTKEERSGGLWVVTWSKRWGSRRWGLHLRRKSWGHTGLAPLCRGSGRRETGWTPGAVRRGQAAWETHFLCVPRHNLSRVVIRPFS